MGLENYSVRKLVYWLIALATIGRLCIAAFIELGNDEVYYLTYAFFPSLSHFDHPPMVGWVIQLFTLNFRFDSELFIRLGPVILSAGSTWIIFKIGTLIRDELTGLIAAIIFTSSIYASVIAGIFIMPDAPQLFFWLAGLYYLLRVLPDVSDRGSKKDFYFAGLFIGLSMLSKYTSVFLWIGAVSYILFFKKQWLRRKELYLSILISFVIFLPVLIWNFQNNFISFTYHTERVEVSHMGLRFDYFFTEFFGEVLYNNPLVFIMIIMALIAIIRHRHFLSREHKKIILLTAVPTILLFLSIALTRRTLPHWTGPAYTTLILLAACWQRERIVNHKYSSKSLSLLVPALVLIVVALSVGIGQVNHGWFDKKTQNVSAKDLGSNDVTLDLYGWRQIEKQFKGIKQETEDRGLISKDAPIISWRWFPAANLDYYVAYPLKMKVLALGKFEDIHKYAWINKSRGGFVTGMDGWFICTSRDYKNPQEVYGKCFNNIQLVQIIHIYRGRKHVMNAFVFYMNGLKPNADALFGLDKLILNNY